MEQLLPRRYLALERVCSKLMHRRLGGYCVLALGAQSGYGATSITSERNILGPLHELDAIQLSYDGGWQEDKESAFYGECSVAFAHRAIPSVNLSAMT